MSTNTALNDIKARAEGHSAAPWKVEPYLMSDGHRVRVTSPDDGPDFNTAEGVRGPDAELIAAAPKLLAALEAVEELAASAPRAIGFGGVSFSGILIADDVLKLIEEALR